MIDLSFYGRREYSEHPIPVRSAGDIARRAASASILSLLLDIALGGLIFVAALVAYAVLVP